MAQYGEDIFLRGSQRRLQSCAAKLQLRVALKKMPRDAGAQSHGTLKARRCFPVHMARTVVGNVAAQCIQIVAAAFVQAFQRSLQRRQYLEEIMRWLDRRIHQRLGTQFHSACLLQEAEREASHDAEGILTVRPSTGKGDRHALLHALVLWYVGKVDRRLE